MTRADASPPHRYGALSTSELVRRYGFAAPGVNPHDSAGIAVHDVYAAPKRVLGARAWQSNAAAVRHSLLGQLLRRGTSFTLPVSGVPPPAMVLATRMLCARRADTRSALQQLARGRMLVPLPRDAAAELDARVAATFVALAHRAQRQRRDDGHAQSGVSSHRRELAARVRDSERRCFAALEANAARGAHLRVDARTASALLRRCVRKHAFCRIMAARRRHPRPPDLTSPGVLRQLCMAGLVRFRPPPTRRAAAGEDTPSKLPLCCINGTCGAKGGGPLVMPAHRV